MCRFGCCRGEFTANYDNLWLRVSASRNNHGIKGSGFCHAAGEGPTSRPSSIYTCIRDRREDVNTNKTMKVP